VQLGVIYDSQPTNRKLGGLPARTSGALLLVAWEIYMTPSRPEDTKMPPETGGGSYFLIENRLKQCFLDKNLLQDIILKHFVRKRSRVIYTPSQLVRAKPGLLVY
jgi:hypothetical protein